MTETLIALAVVLASALIMPSAVRAMKRSARGRGGDGAGSSLMQGEAFYRPSAVHVIEARQAPSEPIAERDEGDRHPKGRPLD